MVPVVILLGLANTLLLLLLITIMKVDVQTKQIEERVRKLENNNTRINNARMFWP